MKKLTFCLLICTILLSAFAGCAEEKQPKVSPTPEASATADNQKETLADNITFRRGESADGEVLFTGEALENVYVTQDEMGYYILRLSFTENGKQLLARYTTELAANQEALSIWIGEEQISCATVTEAILDGQCNLIDTSYTAEDVTELRNKFYGITSETE